MPPTASYMFENQISSINAGGFASPAGKGAKIKAGSETSSLCTKAPVFTPGKPVRLPTSGPNTDGSPRRPSGSEIACMEEVTAGAQWWSRSLKTDGLSQGQSSAFEHALLGELMKRCHGKWYPSEPMRGSGYRSVINDLTVDPLLVAAGDSARISNIGNRLPKAVVWINPGAVRVQLNSERHACTVFQSSQVTPSRGSTSSGESDEEVGTTDVWIS